MKTKNKFLILVFGFLVAIVIYKLYDIYSVKRWYSSEQVVLGKKLFLKNCAVCHGDKAQKTIKWKKPLADGAFPPPPLNGSAHAWHHPKSKLKEIVETGGTLYDGKMPPFKGVLSDDEQFAVIAYFQSFWSDEIYTTWKKYGGLTK